MRWPKYWSFSFGIIPSKEHPGLISFRMNWLDLLEVHGSLKSLLQHHSSKASILQHSAWELGNYIVLPMNRSLRAFLALLKMISVSHWIFNFFLLYSEANGVLLTSSGFSVSSWSPGIYAIITITITTIITIIIMVASFQDGSYWSFSTGIHTLL